MLFLNLSIFMALKKFECEGLVKLVLRQQLLLDSVSGIQTLPRQLLVWSHLTLFEVGNIFFMA